jgi:hypothetical protein
MDYLRGGDYIRQKFLSTPGASSCLCSSSMSSKLQHVSGLCSTSSPDAVFRSLQAVVLIFFLLMDPSLILFDTGALHCQYQLIITWWQSQTRPHFMRKRSTLCCIVRPAVPCSPLRLLPMYAHHLSKFEVHTMASGQANDHHQVQPSVHACSFLPLYWNYDRRLLDLFP